MTTFLPSDLAHLEGKILDVDSHEMMPLQVWEETFGPEVAPLAEAWRANGETAETDKNHPNVPGYEGDLAPIDEDVLIVKGSTAPGAADYERRIQVMDAMGVRSQLMFPGSVGLYGTVLRVNHDDPAMFPNITSGRAELGDRCIRLYQDYLLDVAKFSDRIVPVAPIVEDSVEAVIATARRLIDSGIKAIWLPAGLPVGGVSPASLSLDPLWAMCAEADVAVTLHIGGDGRLLASSAWEQAEAFEGFRSLGEFSVDPYSTANLHLPFQNFTSVMVLGGVFDRHPNLRFGVIEVGAHWVGPLMENMDTWFKAMGHFNSNPHKLKELPSTYIINNTRVSFFHFEAIDVYLDRYPGIDKVLAFSTDYPHVEGGKDVFRRTHAKLKAHGQEVVDRIFVDNPAWLLPTSV
ncbi:amidohydrolase family protein [Mycolicibacterium vaccae]|uniref:amidohydrolase family protein n=1 Tax=Mycolicibacterium vaccae TaxID=1810 RepID=UPI003D036AEB